MTTEDNIIPLATPTRFLIESGEWTLTPHIGSSIQNEMNPFDCNFQQRTTTLKPQGDDKCIPLSPTVNTIYNSPEPELSDTSPSTPPMSVSQSPSSHSSFSPTCDQFSSDQSNIINQHIIYLPEENTRRSARIQTKQPFFSDYVNEKENNYKPKSTVSVQNGRKRRIVFEGDDAEDRRKKFLERNRVAAYKCRQKKKNWMQDLEHKAEIQNNHNEELRSLVAQLKEESMYLRNLLLTHSNCDCESVQTYLQKTSAEITSNVNLGLPMARPPLAPSNSTFPSMPSYQGSFGSIQPFPQTSTGLTPFLNTVINKTNNESPSDYFSQSHNKDRA